MSLLEVQSLGAGYGGHAVLRDVTFAVDGGESIALVGRNGMGKSTTLKAIMALAQPTISAGEIRYQGGEVRRRPYEVARAGIGYVPQGRRIFKDLTVREHLELSRCAGRNDAADWTPQRVLELFPRLAERLTNRAGTLSGGEQQMLVIGRALMTNPQLLVLDEPSEGLAPQMVAHVGSIIRDLHATGVAVLLAEQNLAMVRQIADQVCFLAGGTVVETVPVGELDERPELIDKYLGVNRAGPDGVDRNLGVQ